MNLRHCAVLALLLLVSTLTVQSGVAAAGVGPRVLTGSLGAAYKVEVPTHWNGTLLLYSHFYLPPGSPNPAVDARDPGLGTWLMAYGYALAGSAYSHGTGWAVEQAFRDQMALLAFFARRVGPPQRTIAWCQSSGGLISADLVPQFPTHFSGALALCAPLGGAVGFWNENLDVAFALKTLLAPASELQVTHIISPTANLQQVEKILATAQRTPQGRARVALAAALSDIPGELNPTSAAPTPGDFAAQERNQFEWEQNYVAPFTLALRAELEQRAGGNPSWNTGVNYAAVLAQSSERGEIQGLYHQARLSLAQDLATLQRAPRVAGDPRSVDYLSRNINITGKLQVPVLTMHTIGDGIVPVQNEQAFARAVAAARRAPLLRQLYVQRARHCSFTRAETLTALRALMHRLDTGQWGNSTNPDVLNLEAADLESDPALARLAPLAGFYTTAKRLAPAFVPFTPDPYLRPSDSRMIGR